MDLDWADIKYCDRAKLEVVAFRASFTTGAQPTGQWAQKALYLVADRSHNSH